MSSTHHLHYITTYVTTIDLQTTLICKCTGRNILTLSKDLFLFFAYYPTELEIRILFQIPTFLLSCVKRWHFQRVFKVVFYCLQRCFLFLFDCPHSYLWFLFEFFQSFCLFLFDFHYAALSFLFDFPHSCFSLQPIAES